MSPGKQVGLAPTFEGGGGVTQFSSADAQAAMGARDLDA